MVGASALSPSDAVRQEAVVGSAQHVVVTRARVPGDTAVHHCLDYFGFQHPDLELEGGARLVVQFEGILPKTAPRVDILYILFRICKHDATTYFGNLHIKQL